MYTLYCGFYRLIVEVIEATIQCVHVFYRLIVEVIEATLQCVHVFYRLIVEVIESTIQCIVTSITSTNIVYSKVVYKSSFSGILFSIHQ
jgi:phage-related protein